MENGETLSIHGDSLSLFIESEEIKKRVESIAAKIRQDFQDEIPIFLCVLKGAFIFASDLVRAYAQPCEVSFIRLSSYKGTESTQQISTVMGLTEDIKDRSVVIVEDIVDTGLTMQHLLGSLRKYGPKSIKVASLFVKPGSLIYSVHVDYHCFEIPNKFIVGYGLDYNGLYRNLPNIYIKQ